MSPGFSSMSAVGLPQPSDAATAASGRPSVSLVLYRSEVIGSEQLPPVPQHPTFAAPAAARSAAAPYFCWMTSFRPSVTVHAPSYLSKRIYF